MHWGRSAARVRRSGTGAAGEPRQRKPQPTMQLHTTLSQGSVQRCKAEAEQEHQGDVRPQRALVCTGASVRPGSSSQRNTHSHIASVSTLVRKERGSQDRPVKQGQLRVRYCSSSETARMKTSKAVKVDRAQKATVPILDMHIRLQNTKYSSR